MRPTAARVSFAASLLGAILVALALESIAGGHPSAAAQGEIQGWDAPGAARYLDEQLDAWFANGKKLQTGRGETVCISCHTTLPYVLARPALRRAMRAGGSTPQEARLIEDVTRRVETDGAHQLLYDSDEPKKIASRSTEAVLNALILGRADAEEHRRDGSEAARAAFRQLWQTQRSDGAWNWLDFALEPWETFESVYAGATLAAIAVGTAADNSGNRTAEATTGIRRLRAYLNENYAAQSVFNRVWALVASTRFEGVITLPQREVLIAEIQSRQREDGGWSLETLGPWKWSSPAPPFGPPGTPDASLLAKSDGFATGLIVYALRQAGISVDRPVVGRGLQWLRANQQRVPVGEHTPLAWRAHSLNYDREHGGPRGVPWRRMFMSNSATAFAALALVGPECGALGLERC
jgi:squalene-hopene/tetraprenyl-beta-curcumene cyclase